MLTDGNWWLFFFFPTLIFIVMQNLMSASRRHPSWGVFAFLFYKELKSRTAFHLHFYQICVPPYEFWSPHPHPNDHCQNDHCDLLMHEKGRSWFYRMTWRFHITLLNNKQWWRGQSVLTEINPDNEWLVLWGNGCDKTNGNSVFRMSGCTSSPNWGILWR